MRLWYFISLYAGSVIFFSHSIFSQFQKVSAFYSVNINALNGLPTNNVNYVFKDRLGFYWIGTQSGLCKYDGYKIQVFKNNPNDTNSLKGINIYCINEYENYIVISHNNGVSLYDYIKNRFVEIPAIKKELNNKEVFNVLISNNKMYLASQKGLYEYNFQTGKLIQYRMKNNPTAEIELVSDTRFFKNNQHFLLVDINLGILKIDTINHGIYEIIKYSDTKARDIVQYGNMLYVLYSEYGLIQLDAQSLEKINEWTFLKNKLKNTFQFDLVTLNNKIYIIGHKDGIIEFDPLKSDFKFLILNDNVNDMQIKRVFNIDNNLVLATVTDGIYIIPYSVQKIFNPIPDEINKQFTDIYAICEYRSGRILVGGTDKLYLYNILTERIEKNFNSLFNNTSVLQIIPSNKQDEVFVGTYGRGLYLLNIETGKIQHLKEKGDILSLFLDNDTLWIGEVGEGITKYITYSKKYFKWKLFDKQTINYIKKDKNNYYIATADNGLYKLNDKYNIIFNLSTKNNKLSNDWVYHFTEDSTYFYIATDNGLTLYNKKDSTSRFFYDYDGLPASTILSVYKDSKNNLWIGTLKGISKMKISNLNNPHLKLFYNYSYIEGLVNYEFDQNAFAVLKNNYLVYGGTSGLDIFNPLKIKSSFSNIPIYITSFKISGKDYITDTNVILKKFFQLNWKQNNFQIELTALHPLNSEKILYKYKLVGYDDEYTNPTNIRYISYTGLPGGTYKLEILATNADGEWNTTPYYIYIDITPPFWKTPWFIISASVLLFGGIFGFNQYRTYQIKKRNKELEEKVKERTKELANKNHEILSSIEYAKRIQQAILPTNKYVEQILPNAFILYIPKDIVSGDFYWTYQIQYPNTSPSLIVAAVDCTGHGVPGALMSMIGNNLLNQIVIEKNITSPEIILNEMNKGVQTVLKQGQSEIQTNDGMDASIVHLFADGKLLWAGAYRPLLIVRADGTQEKIEGDKYPIGGVQMDPDRKYTLHTSQLNKGDTIYLFSDGYADQFGGEKGKKMMLKRFFQLISENHSKPIDEQKEILERFFYEWKGKYDQVDDVLVIGIKY